MSRPEVTLDNYQAVYDYYVEHEPSQLALRSLHRISSMIYHPNVQYEDNSAERIPELLADNHRLIIVSNHVNACDQFAIGALMQRGPLKPIIGHTFALAKQPYFRIPLLRKGLDAVGAVPVYRTQDNVGRDSSLQLNATLGLINTVSKKIPGFEKKIPDKPDKIIEGSHMVVFGEGTRNNGDPRTLNKIKGGIGHMAIKSSKKVPVDIVPMTIWYGDGVKHSRKPNIVVGNPIEPPFKNANQITNRLQEYMQYCLDMAIKLDD